MLADRAKKACLGLFGAQPVPCRGELARERCQAAKGCAQDDNKSHQAASGSECAVDLPLRLVFGLLVLQSFGWWQKKLSPPCSLGAPGIALVKAVLSVFINFPRVPVCRALPNASPCFDRGSEGACKWYFCKKSAACALSGVSQFIALRYSRYEVMLKAMNVKPYNLQPLGPQFCSAI